MKKLVFPNFYFADNSAVYLFANGWSHKYKKNETNKNVDQI